MALSFPPLPPLAPLRQKAIEGFRALSFREHMLILAAMLAVTVFIIANTYRWVTEKFVAQSEEIASLEAKKTEVIESLGRFAVLNARRESIEDEYTKGGGNEGVRAHLERLLREKAGITTGAYTIRDLPTSQFGGGFQLAPYSVKFTAVSLQGVVDFLREITRGSRPLILSELDMKKGRVGERMDVTVDVSSISKATN